MTARQTLPLSTLLATVLLVGAAGDGASGAPPGPLVGPERQLPTDPGLPQSAHRVEPVIEVTPFAFGDPLQIRPREIVVGCNVASNLGASPNMEFNLSLDEGVTWTTTPITWDAPCTGQVIRGDPMVAVSALVGDLYIGGLATGTLKVRRRPYGSTGTTFLDPVTVFPPPCSGPAGGTDKGFMAMGPQPGGDPAPVEALYAAWTDTSVTPRVLSTIKAAETQAPPGDAWGQAYPVTSDLGQVERTGLGAYPVIVTGGPFIGRLVLASQADKFESVPEVTYTDYGGQPDAVPPGQQLWATLRTLSRFGDQGANEIFPLGNPPPLPGGTKPPGAPSVAVDPINPSHVYIIFPGRTSAGGSNIDLFIARSSNSGTTFAPEDTVRVTDAMLRVAADCPGGQNCPETDEWLPAIVIDELGGINILYVRSAAADAQGGEELADAVAEVRYARWADDGALSANTTPFIARLGPTRVWFAAGGVGHDYQMLKASGCYVYLAYSRAAAGTGPWRAYFRRIVVGPCRADVYREGIIDSFDIVEYFNQWFANDPEADMDGDGEVTESDLDSFFEGYIEGSEVPT